MTLVKRKSSISSLLSDQQNERQHKRQHVITFQIFRSYIAKLKLDRKALRNEETLYVTNTWKFGLKNL